MECAGCADRSCYDLTRHSKATKTDLTAKVDLPEPVSITKCFYTDKGVHIVYNCYCL